LYNTPASLYQRNRPYQRVCLAGICADCGIEYPLYLILSAFYEQVCLWASVDEGIRLATVTSRTRKFVDLLDEQQQVLHGRFPPKLDTLAVGDKVHFKISDNTPQVVSLLKRKNYLSRAQGKKEKLLATNLDLLVIMSATSPPFSHSFVDRMLAIAWHQNIPCTLLVNKLDLGLDSTEPLMNVYERIGFEVLSISAKFGDNVDALTTRLQKNNVEVAALAGISGVGKSTLLNRLSPEAFQKTGTTSSKTGQGKQTTSTASAHFCQHSADNGTLIIDLPGVQNIGVTHLTKEEVAESFIEIRTNRDMCQYSNCQHLAEPGCAVKEAVKTGTFEKFRYKSYTNMLQEIESAKPY